MSEIRISNITNRAGTSGAVIAGVTSSIGTGYAKMVSGDNSERVGIESGSIRYNSTAKVLEFYDGTQWNFILPAEESANALGVFGGGNDQSTSSTLTNVIQYLTISTLGDATYFGDLTVERGSLAACSSSTRGVFAGGDDDNPPSIFNTIDYITIATTGNATDFGDLPYSAGSLSACSSSTRGVIGGYYDNALFYITIATTGNAFDFGDLLYNTGYPGACSSSTRGIFGGGCECPVINTINYITIASQGTNATDFGDLTQERGHPGCCSSSTRGVFGGGYLTPNSIGVDIIDYITIATTGNAIDFGDLTETVTFLAACSSSTRGVFGGGYGKGTTGGGFKNSTEYITIATTGNAINFGNLYFPTGELNACSNNHGGLL